MKLADAQELSAERFGLDEHLPEDAPGWLHTRRASGLARFHELGLPTTRHEEWKFTSVNAIAERRFSSTRADAVRPGHVEPFLFAGLNGIELVFVNGRFVPDQSRLGDLPKGAMVGSLADLATRDGATLDRHLGRHIKFEQFGFTALNTASLADGAVVILPADAVVERPIHVLYVSTADEPSASHPRTLIVAGPHAQARLIESYAGPTGAEYLTNAVTEIVGEEGSQLDHYKVQRESTAAYHVSSTHIALGRSAVFTSHSITMGGGLVRNDVNAVLDAEGILCTVNGLYLVDGNRLVDNHTAIDHAKPHCESHELYKGVLTDRARGVFNGKIFVRPDAQKTDAKQTNQVLLLSEDATINTKPQLEIFADDVKCTHGATVGQLSDEALFYLRSRGIGAEEARALLIHAFAEDIIDRIQIGVVRQALEHELLKTLPVPVRD
jgi:Fe-S cluster assembly protein SufD